MTFSFNNDLRSETSMLRNAQSVQCQSSVNSEIWLRFRVMLCSVRRRDGRCDVGVWQNVALLLGILQDLLCLILSVYVSFVNYLESK